MNNPSIPRKQQQLTQPTISHKQRRRTQFPPLTKWNVKSHKSKQTPLQTANYIAKPRCKAGKRGVRVKGKRVQVHFERVRNELEEHREGAGGKSPLCLGFILSPAPLGVLFASSPQTNPNKIKKCQPEEVCKEPHLTTALMQTKKPQNKQ